MYQKIVEAHPKHGVYVIALMDSEIDRIHDKHKGFMTVRISEPEEPGTEKQNRAAHALLAAYFATGLHSSPAKNISQFKLWAKCVWGPCMDWSIHDTPVRVPMSWADYSKKERQEFLDCLISDIRQSGADVESKKIREILAGMESE